VLEYTGIMQQQSTKCCTVVRACSSYRSVDSIGLWSCFV